MSDSAILRHISTGSVVITPFSRENLSTSSYDVTLGPFFYRESNPEPGQGPFWHFVSSTRANPSRFPGIYNPYSEQMVNKVWGAVCEAELHSEWCKRNGAPLENISPSERIIWLKPGETILGHTNEFIGGRKTVTTMMKARSSLGRNFIEVCKCAGWGDVGYVNRWTMEITNNSRYYSIPLVVGRRVAQIVFFGTEGIEAESYEKSGKYQTRYDCRCKETFFWSIEPAGD